MGQMVDKDKYNFSGQQSGQKHTFIDSLFWQDTVLDGSYMVSCLLFITII